MSGYQFQWSQFRAEWGCKPYQCTTIEKRSLCCSSPTFFVIVHQLGRNTLLNIICCFEHIITVVKVALERGSLREIRAMGNPLSKENSAN